MEHIIIDGGSDDETVTIIRRYALQYPHIRWISEKDRGQSDAMNKGILMAKGPIICFLNADDFFEPDTLNRVIRRFKQLPEPSLLVGNCNVLDDKNHLIRVNKPNRLKITDLLVGTKIFIHPVNPSAYFYHKSIHAIVGMYDIEDQFSMDVDFIFRAVQHAHTFYVDEMFGNFRFFPGTKTYNDLQENKNSRIKKVIRKYQKQLSLKDQLLLIVRKAWYYPAYYGKRGFLLLYEQVFKSGK